MKPSKAPREPWTRVYADHWGPMQDGPHILVVIDGMTRYPEVVVVRGTSAEDSIHAFSDKLFCSNHSMDPNTTLNSRWDQRPPGGRRPPAVQGS